MKVIVQNPVTGKYLAGNGQWVGTAGLAEDFLTILQAYSFAKHHASGRFQVILYCPDDHYTKNLIEGIGIASPQSPTPCLQVHGVSPVTPQFTGNRSCRVPLQTPRAFDIRNYRN